jgi:hypothetical protein
MTTFLDSNIPLRKLPAALCSAHWPALLLLGAVCGVLLNIMSLPMLPTNDGPLHTYYAQVFSHLLAGHSIYSGSFAIRSVFPPYALHFYLLVLLHRYFDYYLTERIIACIVILWTFVSFARLSSALGGSGLQSCFVVLPFLANWLLYMGFTNFALGLATLLFALGYWLDHIEIYGARQALTTVFLVFLLAAEHPVTLSLFFIFVALELVGSYSIRPADFHTGPNGHRLMGYLRKRQLPVMLIFTLGLLASFWMRAFVKEGASPVIRVSFKEIARRIFSLITLNEISPFSFEWWLYTVALLSVALPVAVFAFQYGRTRLRDPRVFAVVLFLLFCLAAYLVVPTEMNNASHVHRRFSATAIFLLLALGSAAPTPLLIRRTMMIVALIATMLTTGLQAKANREVIARIAPSIKACIVPPASRLLVIRFGTPIYGHPLRYMLDDAAPAYWAANCQAIFVNSTWLSQSYYPLRTANGAPSEIDASRAGLAIQRAVQADLPIPYAPDVLAIESFDGGIHEKKLIAGLEKRYGFSPFPGINGNYIYLFR